MAPTVLVAVLVLIALAFDFFNGMHDSANTVATLIASRATSPRRAMALVALCEMTGPFIFGVSVATTVGNKVVDPTTVTVAVTLSALLAAIAWNVITLRLGIPSSSSHALLGGLLGAALWGYGSRVILVDGLVKVVIALFLSPILGLVVAYLVMRFVLFLMRGASPRVNVWFRRAQWITAGCLALSHGTNDAQKTMGVITMGLVATGLIPHFEVPLWVVAAAAFAIALGTFVGGWRVIKTLGCRFFKVRPMHAFASQVSSATIILGAALWGGPVSTTQVVSSSILGAGSGHRASQVRWGIAADMLVAWLLTMPATGLLAGLLYTGISQLVR